MRLLGLLCWFRHKWNETYWDADYRYCPRCCKMQERDSLPDGTFGPWRDL